MYTESDTLWRGLVMNSDQEMGKQVMGLYFCGAEVRDFDACQRKGFDILSQVRDCDALAEVKVFGCWVDATKLFQAAKQGLCFLIYEETPLYCSVNCLCFG